MDDEMDKDPVANLAGGRGFMSMWMDGRNGWMDE